MTPRGIRNNNPLNIRVSSAKWKGKVFDSTDKEFEQFTTMEYGLRAAFLIIRTYKKMYRVDTIGGIIRRWAPRTENNTAAYIKSVTYNMSRPENYRIDVTKKNDVCLLVWNMARFETGWTLSFGRVENAWALAFKN